MMATEATPEILATSSTTPDDELNTTESASQDVSPPNEQTVVNGTSNTDKDGSKQVSDKLEPGGDSAEVSVSGGSDTEASKAETSKTQSGHLRTTSTVKKALSFKPVSVNKTFLAAKGATTPATSKLGDKGAAGSTSTQTGPSTSSAPRPRLVAKSGSGLRDSTPRNSATANGNKAGAAPDASAVWNKNRPAAPPEPKRFTDEELKQRYGIHLATRLQSDDPGKEKNWADIDDDDDDWAPETIEWTDGTKITLPQAEDPPAPAPEPTPEPAAVEKEVKPVEAPKSKSPAPVRSASPAVKSTSSFGSGRAGLVLKGAAEKPTLVAKPPGPPTPVKSPWASLPPVDKVAPVAIEIPQNNQTSSSRFGQRDPHGFQAMPPPPAKEIAADDFSRSWRDGNTNSSRELYNSQSGRYEPVNDNRRGPARNDARQPAVLQRPQQDGPAEPSAAFQTHRAGGQDPSFNRRRTSSNVSGGSGNFRRMSRGAVGHELPSHDLRRGSLAAVSDAPSSPRPFSPSGQPAGQTNRGPAAQQWQSRASPATVSHPSPQSAHGQLAPSISGSVDGQSAPVPIIDEEAVFQEQKKRMLLARELAIKRRQEEEAREEAAKRERIRIKLEAMGPLPEKPSKAATPKQDKAVPVTIQARQQPIPSSDPPQAPAVESNAIEAKVNVTEPPREPKPAVSTADIKSEKSESRANGTHHESKLSPSASRQNFQEQKPTQPWQSNSAQSSGPWAPPQQTPSRSVWGPPTNDRTLGNGTFNPELSRVPNLHTSQQHPGPIGPPNQNRGNNSQFSQGRRDPFVSRPAPIGPPPRHMDAQMEEQRRQVASSPWALAAEKVQRDDSIVRQKQEAETAERRKLEAQGLLREAPPVYKETWREMTVNEHGDRTKQTAPESVDAALRPHTAVQSEAIGNQFGDTWRNSPNNNSSPRVRDSRFFPNNRDVRLEEQSMPYDRPASPSPPPPTMAGHPVYDGDATRPLVSLPKPAPVVKLPPPTVLAPIGPPKPATFAAAVIAPAVPLQQAPAQMSRQDHMSRAASSQQDARKQPEAGASPWQDRINSLIGRKPTGNSPPKSSHALAVDSSSKNALELPRSQSAATVSLPSLSSGVLASDDGSTVSKPAAEECFEEQEMGSLPPIKLPTNAPAAAWSPAPQIAKSIPRKFQAAEVVSMEPIDFPYESVVHNRFTLRIHLPGKEEKVVTGPFTPRQRSNPRRGGGRGRGTPQTSSPNVRGGRGKENSFSSPKSENSTASAAPHHTSRGSHRGGGRGYGNNWNRHVSTPVQT
ncbi:hypothetical protein HYFRA_00004724 [Hymenoscyphus fraxineus]|uniref:Uncharacterized protein n=1 Tax=Hymenoscyphus fraxineus TaxID=746836 RepID=A0A9N9PIR0_9HELO|nr:hypothetical protein HYFRA_00004724 [Hymenoscyphus fraxineus]